MIVMVSTKTCIAREPDQSASTNPTEITSNRPPCSTSSMVGWMTRSTAESVRKRDARSRIAVRTWSTWSGLNDCVT